MMIHICTVSSPLSKCSHPTPKFNRPLSKNPVVSIFWNIATIIKVILPPSLPLMLLMWDKRKSSPRLHNLNVRVPKRGSLGTRPRLSVMGFRKAGLKLLQQNIVVSYTRCFRFVEPPYSLFPSTLDLFDPPDDANDLSPILLQEAPAGPRYFLRHTDNNDVVLQDS